MRRVMVYISACMAVAITLWQPPAGAVGERFRNVPIPEPRLLVPVAEVVDLTGKATLRFAWSPHEGERISRKRYDFRVYRGRAPIASACIFRDEIKASDSETILTTDYFKDGETYTWALRQVYEVEGKSRWSSQAFTVIRKT